MGVEAKILRRADELQAHGVSDHTAVVCVFVDAELRRRRFAPVLRCVLDSGGYEAAAATWSPQGAMRSTPSAIGWR